MKLDKRIKSFIQLSEFLKSLNDEKFSGKTQKLEPHFHKFKKIIETEHFINSWFTPENIKFAINSIANSISEEKIDFWLEKYKKKLEQKNPKSIGVILAGNIPLVGFHDLISVLISGNIFVGKTSSKDKNLTKALVQVLIEIEPEFSPYVKLCEGRLENFDAVIATGSNNSARYFEQYFGKYPHIIRKNRNSVAVISPNQTKAEIEKLSDDIFAYFGLGCRNVSKLFLPKGFSTDTIFEALYKNKEVINHHNYANNYDYNRAIYLINSDKFLDNNFLMLKESQDLSSPISVLYYEFYDSLDQLSQKLEADKHKLQCIVSETELPNLQTVKFSQAQHPQLWDYADNVNTLDFLLNL